MFYAWYTLCIFINLDFIFLFMQPNELKPQTILPQSPMHADDRTHHHKKIMLITALGFITLLIALGIGAWFIRKAELKQQSLLNQYQAESFQNSLQGARAFFKDNSSSVTSSTMSASVQTAQIFFKKNPPVSATPAELAAQAAHLQMLQQQGFNDWKASQPK